MTKAKVKAPRSTKQAKQKLVRMMREMEKTTGPVSASKTRGTCVRIYCI